MDIDSFRRQPCSRSRRGRPHPVHDRLQSDPHTDSRFRPASHRCAPSAPPDARRHSVAGLQDAPEHDVADLLRFRAGAREASRMTTAPRSAAPTLQRAAERADWRPACAEDDRLGVFFHPIIIVRSRVLLQACMLARTARVAPALVVLFASAAAAQPKRAMTADNVIDPIQLSAPGISPDGRRVLYSAGNGGGQQARHPI